MSHVTLHFGEYRVDPAARELQRGDALLQLSPKVFDCLAYLIEHRDRAVGRDELIAAVWGRVDVSDTLLGQTVLKARRAVGDTGNEQHAIRTVPRFGYRWVAPIRAEEGNAGSEPTDASASVAAEAAATGAAVSHAPDTPAPDETPREPSSPAIAATARTHHAWTWLAAMALVTLLGLGIGYLSTRQPAPTHAAAPAASAARPADSTAVLPAEISDPGDGSWLRLGLMDLVATRLRSAGLPVVPSDNVVALMRNGGDIAARRQALAAATGALFMVQPTVSGRRDRWTVHLAMHTANGKVREVEAHDADVIVAGRTATDHLLALLGKRAPDSSAETRDLPAAELLSRTEAALLSDDLDGARHLIENAPPALQRSPELRFRLAQIDFRAGQLASARQRMGALIDETGAEADPVLRARALNGMGVIDIRSEQPADAEHAFTEAIGLLENRNQPAALGQAYTGRAVSYAARGDYAHATADFSRARIALELSSDALGLARLEANEGIVSAKRGRFADALASAEHAAQRFERFGALNELVLTLGNAAYAQLMLLRPVDALATTERGTPLLGRLENRSTKQAFRIERATALAANGRVIEARALLNDLATEVGTDANALLLARIHLEQAQLEFNSQQFGVAADLAASAVIAFDNPDYQRERASAWLLLTRSLRAQGEDRAAAAEVERLRHWAAGLPMPPVPTYAALAEAERHWALRDRSAAQTGYAEALTVADKADVPVDTAQVVVSYGNSLLAEGELQRAGAVVGQVARWADTDFACALLQVRYYRALGERDAWQAALRRAQGLAGERTIPLQLGRLPEPGKASSADSIL